MIFAWLKTLENYLLKLPITRLDCTFCFCRFFLGFVLNALSDVTNIVTENYLLEHEIKKDIGKVKQRIFGILLSCYCQTGAKLLTFLSLILDANAFEHMFYTYRSGIDYNAESFKILNLK